MEQIIKLYSECEKSMKIYVYPFYPKKFKSLFEFINYVKNDKSYLWGETYKSWLYFTEYLINSKLFTTDENEADLYLVLQWENYNKGREYYNDLVLPLERAINHKIYKSTNPIRNHIFIYISDETPLYEKRIPLFIRKELEKRFIRLTYSGRIPFYGRYHTSKTKIDIFNFDYQNEIVLPCGIPSNDLTKEIKLSNLNLKDRNNKFYYQGTLNPPEEQIERKEILNLIKKHSNINSDTNNIYGIHAAGWGIWTARFYHYLQLGIIPIFQSDGVIMPFERFFNYESFSIKLLSNKSNDDIITKLKNINLSKSNIQNMLNNIEDIKHFFNWKSNYKYKNPFTLTIIELYEYVKLNNNKSKYLYEKSYIAKKEFCHIEKNLPKLYREQNIHEDSIKLPLIEFYDYIKINNKKSKKLKFFIVILFLLVLFYYYKHQNLKILSVNFLSCIFTSK
jgi:hypothetical protein